MLRLAAAAAATFAALAAFGPTAALALGEPAGVTGIALDARVELAWTPVTGATSYNVYRATTPTGITTPLSTGVLTPFHTDTTAANGTPYYYVVRSVTSGVESGDSLVVQSTPKARSCATGNETRLENCYPGDSAWTLQNQNAPSGIDGFATASSINKGESLDLKVSVDSAATAYRLEIFRSGFYGDVQARLFSVVRGLNGGPQPACTTDAPTGLVDCANWSRSATITTTGSWPSGVYFVRLVREDNGSDNYVVFVVRDDARRSELLYGLGFATYQAYNNYGGKSLYDFNSTGANTVAGATRAVKVSYDRPYAQARGGGHNFYFVTDSAWISWLEEQGYDVAYQSDTDLERNGARARDHRVYMLSAHDEYYSSGMRTALEQARDAGINLFSTGANQVYWKIRYENGAGGQDRIQVCYKSTQSGGADPSGIPTGTWRDPAGANRPENALLGVMYVGDNDSQNFPLVVSAAQSADPVYRGTTLANSTSDTSVGTNIVGWEWDARINNGFEPAGVTTLSNSPASGNLIQNNGANGAPGSTTVSAVKYRAPAPSNALVFSAGTNFWSHGLAGTIYAPTSPDVRIQQTTLNILTDMGATPETPATGLTIIPTPPGGGGGAGDTGGAIAPTVIEKVPADGSASTSTGTNVRAIFSTDMNAATITSSSFTLAPSAGGTNIAATVAYDALSRTATLTPSAPLALGTSYQASLTSTIQSSTNEPLAATSWTFSTASCPCTLFAPTSAPVAQNNPTQDGRAGTGPFSYELGVKVTVDQPMQVNSLRFFKTSQESGVHTGKIWSSAGAILAQAEFALETPSGWQHQPLAGPLTLQPGQVYTVSVNANEFFSFTSGGLAAQVTSGALRTVVGDNGVFGSTAGVFPTSSFGSSNYFVDLEVVNPGTPVAPSVTAVTPRSLTATASTATDVTATFSTTMNAATINGTTFTLTGPGGAAVAGAVTYVATTRTAQFTPSSPLATGTAYTATLAPSISDTGGSTLASPASWTFTTTSSCVCSFFPATLTPTSLDNSTQDNRVGPGPWSREFGLKFTVLQTTRLTAFRFYKTPAERGSHTGKLWANGALVTQAVYVTESASGWQHQALATPVTLQPGINYTLSINANDFFAFSGGGLATQVNAGPAQTIVGENGVFSEAAGVFPTQHFNNSNYFVDLQVADGGLEPPPAPTDASPRGGERQVATTSAVRVTFSRDMDATTITGTSFTLKKPDASAVPAVVTYHAPSRTATLTPNAPLDEGTTYTANLDATIRAAAGGPALADAIAWSFTTLDSSPPETTITSSPANPTAVTSASFAFSSDDPDATFACQIDGAGFGACVSPKTYTGLADGSHTFEVRATDPLGNVDPTPASFTWTIDSTGPDTSITSAPADPSSSTGATFGFTSTEPTGATYRCSLDGAPAVLCVSGVSYSGLAEGTHTFTVASTDLTGNPDTTPATHTWQINITPPDTTITSAPASPTTATSATFEFTSTKPAGGTFECALDGGAATACTSPHTYPGPLADGTHNFQVTAIDASGRRDPSPATHSWTISSPPTVTSRVPASGATGIAANAAVSATFSRAMDATTIGATSFTLTGPSGAVGASVTYNGATNTATLSPSAALANNTTYTAQLSTAIKAADGIALASAVSWSFTTIAAAPTVTANTPAAGATGVANTVSPTATFSRAMDATTITNASFTLTGPSGAVTATVAYNSGTNTATLTPSTALVSNTTYTAQLSTSVKSSDGVNLANPFSWTFTTINAAPTVTARTPAPGATGVATGTNVTATFSRGMDQSTIGVTSFTLTGPSGAVAAGVAYNGATNTATLTPSAALASNTTYTVQLESTIKASDGVALASPVSWTFTTVNAAPTVTARTPAPGATGVATNATVSATFSRAMDATTIGATSFTLTGPSGAVTATVSYNSATNTATLSPSAALANNTTYTANLTTAIKAADGVALASAVSWTFTTVNAAPTVTSTVPANGATGIATNVVLSAAFSRAMDSTTIGTSSFTLTGPAGSVTATVSYNSATNTATLSPSAALATNTTYTANLAATIKAADGVALASAVSWTFTTVNAAPTVTARTPAPGATGVATGTNVTATFSRAMDATTIGATSFTLTGPSGTVTATVSYNSATNTATLSPSAALATNTTYTANLATTIKAADGVALASAVSWTFTTVNAAPTVTARTPAPGATGVATGTNVSATFSRAMDATTISATSFTLTGPSGAVTATVAYNSATNTATLTPSAALATNTTYTANLAATIKAADGVNLASAVSWTFTTVNAAPTVTARTPAPGATGIATNSTVSATFSRAMDAATITNSSFTLSGPSGAIAATVAYNTATNTATLTPTAALANNTTYTANLATTIKAADGVNLASAVSWTFTTVNAAPTVTSTAPTSGATGIATNSTVSATFSRAMDATTIGASSFTLTGPSGAVTATVSYNGATNTATLTPGAALANNTTYTATLANTIKAADGVALAGAVSWTFTTVNAAPTVTSTTPLAGATGVSAGIAPTATFSRAMDAGTITAGSFTLTGPSGAVTATVAYNSATNTATLTPGAALANNTTYTATLANTIKAADGVALAGAVSWTFTTVNAAPTVTTRTPAPSATGVATGTNVTATFSRAMDASTITSSSFTLTGPTGAVAGTVSYSSATNTATLTPGAALANNTTYTAQLSTAIKAADGVALASAVSWTFTTVNAVPTVTARTPAPSATGVATGTNVTATFSRAMDATTITSSSFTLTGPSGAVAGTVAYNSATNTATLTPGAALANNTTYTATLATSIKAADGVNLASAVSWTFTTVNAAPTVTARTPAPSSTGVATGTNVTATFSRAMDATTIGATSFTLTGPSGAVTATVAYNSATNTATLSPSASLANNTTYTANLATSIRAADGVALASAVSWTFTTVNAAPTVTGKTPADGSTGIATNVAPSATFSRAMDPATIANSSFTLTGPGGAVTATVAYNSATNTATLTPGTALANNTTYTATLTTTIAAADGVALANAVSWSFTTIVGDVTPPDTTISSGPAAFTSSTSASIVFASTEAGSSFTCKLDTGAAAACTTPATYTALADGSHTVTVTATDAAGNPDPTPATHTWTVDTVAPDTTILSNPTNPTTATTATFTFNSSDTPATHECRIDGGAYATCTSPKDYTGLTAGSHTFDVRAVDAAGNVDATPATYTWTINSSGPPTVTASSPAGNATNVSHFVKPSITFSRAMDATSITTTTLVLRKPDNTTVSGNVAYDSTTYVATFVPFFPLDYSKTYRLEASTGIKSADGQSLASLTTISFTTTGDGYVKRIEAGSTTPFTTGAGLTFDAESNVSATSGGIRTIANPIAGTTDDGLYQTQRWGLFTYNITVPNGTYDIKLHFAELSATAAGQRVFHMDVLETTLSVDIQNLDIYAAAGANTAYVRTIPNVTTTASRIRIRSTAATGDPVVAGIEIIPRIPTVTTTTPAAGATGVATSTTVKATFSRGMDVASMTGSTFMLRTQAGAAVAATVSYDTATKTATLKPSSALAPATTYVAEVARSVRALDGMTMAGAVSWSFTTK